MSSQSPISLSVSYRGSMYPISLLPDSTLEALQIHLEELTSVPPPLQKLLYKGNKVTHDSAEVTLAQAGLKDGMKVQMLGSTTRELGGLRSAEDAQRKRERILRERALKPPTKVRSTASASTESTRYRFHSLQPLDYLPNPPSALAVLQRFSNDRAILHVMQKHQFSVGLLTELGPQDDPKLLGLNVNGGQAIKLRLRTDDYTGFRNYNDVRKVLCHELAHNVWGNHDNEFKELNSKLNREVAEFERSVRDGTHYLSGGPGMVYEPPSELEREAETHTHILGGGDGGPPLNDTQEDRRRRILEATMNRLRKEEEALEQSCGTAGPSTTSVE